MWAVIHLIAWVAIVILTISAFSIYPKNNKVFTILQMINRVFYIIVIGSGIIMARYGLAHHLLPVIFKILLGILVIGTIEMLLSYRKKDRPTTLFFSLFFVSVILTVALGFYLSGGYPLV